MTNLTITGCPTDLKTYETTATEATKALASTSSEVTADKIPAAKAENSNPAEGINDLPTVPDPLSTLSGTFAVPSLSANVLTLVQNLSDEQRRANNEQRIAQSKNIVEQIHDQADKMRAQAAWNLVLGLTVAVGQVAAGVTQGVMSTSALNKFSKNTITAEQLQGTNAKISGINQAISGSASAVSSVKDFVSTMYDASIKDRDASIEQARAYLAQLDSLNDALKEVIRSARENQSAIQQNTNQTRVKILS